MLSAIKAAGVLAVLTCGTLAFAQPAKPVQAVEPAEVKPVQALKVGDKAPPLAVGKWVKGDAVTAFEPGTAYIVEFWATWCGPCIEAMPHLSETARAHKGDKLKVVAVSIWERNPSRVAPFVEKMGDKMDFAVAMDNVPAGGNAQDDGAMSKGWMIAAGLDAIPATFIVDRSGTIAFIGHPSEVDEVLPKVLSGDFDAKGEGVKKAKLDKLRADLDTALKGRQWDKALTILDELANEPSIRVASANMRFAILLDGKKDADAAFAAAARFADNEFKDDAVSLNEVAWTIVDRPGLTKRDFELALRLASRAADLTKHENANILDTLARVYFEKGLYHEAVKWQTKAAELSEGEEKATFLATLMRYQTVLKEKGS